MIRRLAVLAFFLGCGGSDEGLPADGAIRDTNPSEAPAAADAPAIDAPSVDAPSVDAPMIDAEIDAEPPDAAPLTNGQPCSMGTDCASGQCADGVCCNVDCSGRCRACNLAGSIGTCTFHGAGSDPENECADQGQASCGANGFCDGAGACQLYSSSTQCAAATCPNSVTAQAASFCSGGGACVSGATQNCSPYVCNAGACRSSCTQNGDCTGGFECAAGVCKKSNGQPCSLGSECATGQCFDGVCCNVDCSGACRACNIAGAVGTCSAYTDGTDPENECAAQAVSTCGLDGLCNGAGACRLYAAGTQCAAPACATGTSSRNANLCDGAGTCTAGNVVNCSPYVCSAPTGACLTTCTSNSDCAIGFACRTATGQCLKVDGQTCLGNSECLNNACCSGVCRNLSNDLNHCGNCSTACTNSCGSTSCSGGTCAPVCNSTCASCDSNPNNGCETSTLTNTNCGGCGIPCSRANAAASCSTGTCVLGSCNSGFANCDGNDSNGCEVNLNNAAACASAQDLGMYCGDTACGFLCPASSTLLETSRSGRGNAWFHARANECSDCPASITAQVQLLVPAGVDYDLYVYNGCGGTVLGSSTNGTGQADQVNLSVPDNTGSDDSFDYWIEIRFFGGASCAQWTLNLFGTGC